MVYNEIKIVKFTPKQWKDIIHRLSLPDEARPFIEKMVSHYSLHKEGHNDYQTRSAALDELRSLENQLAKLTLAFRKMGERTRYALFDSGGNASSEKKLEIWNERIKTIEDISTAIQLASKDLRTKTKVKSGPKSFAVDQLVKELNRVVLRYRRKGLNRGKVSQDFVRHVLKLAEPSITQRTVDSALTRLSKKRFS